MRRGLALLACILLAGCAQTGEIGAEVALDPSSSGTVSATSSSGGATSSTGSLFSSSTGSDAYAQARQDCVDSINAFRATESLPPLERWTAQESCVDNQSRLDSESGVAHGAFGDCGERAQNECPGWGSVEQILSGCLSSMWAEGPGEPYSEHGHYLNMSGDYTKVACGFYETPDGEFWHIEDFQ